MDIIQFINAFANSNLSSTTMFAGLFVWLFYNTRKESNARESRLTQIIDRMVDKLDSIVERLDKIDHDVEDIRRKP